MLNETKGKHMSEKMCLKVLTKPKRLDMLPNMCKKNPAAVALGKLGGSAKSPAKTASARINSLLGGWPKGKKRGKKK